MHSTQNEIPTYFHMVEIYDVWMTSSILDSKTVDASAVPSSLKASTKNIQGVSFQSSSSVVVFAVTGEQKWTEVTRMTTSDKVYKCSHLKHTDVFYRKPVG